MGMLQGKAGGVSSKLPGGAGGALLGAGAGLLAGGLLEHEIHEHERHRRHHHGLGALGGGLIGGGLGGGIGSFFGGGPEVVDVTDVTVVQQDTYVQDDTTVFNF
jgi:hypothetical protein